jgi:hypothetical protein
MPDTRRSATPWLPDVGFAPLFCEPILTSAVIQQCGPSTYRDGPLNS